LRSRVQGPWAGASDGERKVVGCWGYRLGKEGPIFPRNSLEINFSTTPHRVLRGDIWATSKGFKTAWATTKGFKTVWVSEKGFKTVWDT